LDTGQPVARRIRPAELLAGGNETHAVRLASAGMAFVYSRGGLKTAPTRTDSLVTRHLAPDTDLLLIIHKPLEKPERQYESQKQKAQSLPN